MGPASPSASRLLGPEVLSMSYKTVAMVVIWQRWTQHGINGRYKEMRRPSNVTNFLKFISVFLAVNKGQGKPTLQQKNAWRMSAGLEAQ